MIKSPYFVDASIGCLLAIAMANAQTIGSGFGGGGGGGGLAGFTSDGVGISGSGATITANDPVLNLTQTWNNAGTLFTGLKFNVTNNASAGSSLLMDVQIGGSSAFKVDNSPATIATIGNQMRLTPFGSGWEVDAGSATAVLVDVGTELRLGLTALGWGSGPGNTVGSDLFLNRIGPAVLQLGAADAASPVAQTFQVQSIAAGSSNASAAALTVTNNAARGTGTGIGGSIVFQTAPVGLSSTNQNPLVAALIIDGASHVRVGSMTAPSISSCGGGSPSVAGTDQAGIITFGTTATACTLTWTNAYSGTPICTVSWQNNLAVMQFTPSNVNLVLTQTNTSSNKANYICFANKGG